MTDHDRITQLESEVRGMAAALRASLDVVRNVEAEGASDGARLRAIIEIGDAVLRSHTQRVDDQTREQVREKLREEYASGLDSPP